MKLRTIVMVVLLVGGFWLLTTHWTSRLDHLSLKHVSLFVGEGPGSSLELTEAEAAPSYDAEEQNNIAVYKRVLPSVVNITSTALVFDFFNGAVPQRAQGSGFVLNTAGHVLTNYHVVES